MKVICPVGTTNCTPGTANAAVTVYVYDAGHELAAEYGQPADTGTKYLFADALGSTRLETDSVGGSAKCLDYAPFGLELPQGIGGRSACYGNMSYPSGTPDTLSTKFTGKERDAETSLDYFGARYFSGAQGRFTSPDEFKGGIVDPVAGQDIETNSALPYADITDPQTLNKYAYARNNPLRYVDPNGHCIEDLCIGEAILVTAAATAAANYLNSPQGQESIRATLTLAGTALSKAANALGGLIFNEKTEPSKATPPPAPASGESGKAKENTNPYAGPVSGPVTVVDPKGNAIPVKTGEQIQGSKDGSYTQVKDANGNPTGTRIDAGHKPSTHPDPRAQKPHAHVPGIKNPDGTPCCRSTSEVLHEIRLW